ncbi:MAG: M28 family peptidase [Bacteroidota bacterium]
MSRDFKFFYPIPLAVFFSLHFSLTLNAQNIGNLPEFNLPLTWYESHLRFLASDELKGRRAGSAGNKVAARYIAEKFRIFGLRQATGAEGYFQQIPFHKIIPAKGGSLRIGENQFFYGENLLWLSAEGYEGTTEVVWAGNGWVDEAKGIDDFKGKVVKGKVVVIASGFPGATSAREVWRAATKKRAFAKERGAIALIEVYRERIPWQFVKKQFMGERLTPVMDTTHFSNSGDMPHAFVQENKKELESMLLSGKRLNAKFTGNLIAGSEKMLKVPNVIGIIQGSDPDLKEEYILLSAHFDHVGVGKQGGTTTPTDSIFNGARDNGMGVVALLSAAQALATAPPKRSVICLAVNAEEIGLLGSAYYAENPLIPLNQTIFNLNTDGAGYTDTMAVSIIGMNRVGVEAEFQHACDTLGLRIYVDPAPEANLFDRSDNVSFARKGIPAPTLSPGFAEFGPELFKVYHQVSDEVSTINWSYLRLFARTYAYSARLIADKEVRPFWISGDKYEEAGKKLYNIK